MSFRNPWENGQRDGQSRTDPWETRPVDEPEDVRRPPGHRGEGGAGRPSVAQQAPPRHWGRRAVIAAVVVVIAIGVFALTEKSGPTSAASSQLPANKPTAAKLNITAVQGLTADIAPDIPAAAPAGHGLSGQVLGMGGLCLAGVPGTTSVVLATCTASEIRQQWTQDKQAFMLNGKCLGVSPGATAASPVTLDGCNASEAQQWSVVNDQTIKNGGSGLCLAKDVNGNGVEVTGCQPGSQSQTWIMPTTAADPSGLALPVGNMPGWRQVFTDNFTENVPVGAFPAAVSSQWGDYLDGWKDTTHHGTYYPSKVVSIRNGAMNMYLHSENGVLMVAAPYPKIPAATASQGNTYGIYEARFRADPVVGYKTAWLLWPDSNSQKSGGEIDFPEGNLWQPEIKAFSHDPGPYVQKKQAQFTAHAKFSVWHTATTVWTDKQVLFLLDGKVLGDAKNPASIPHTPMHWVLQTETRTGEGPLSATAAGNVDIDWVSVWYEQGS